MSENEKTQLDKDVEALEAKAAETNKGRTGITTFVTVSKTRGKNPIPISYEQFDTSKPDSLPKSIANFMETTGVKDEPTLVSYLIEGRNQDLYTQASDPLAEFVDETWPAEVQTSFRLVVRNYARTLNMPLESAVALIKPGFIAQFNKATAVPA